MSLDPKSIARDVIAAHSTGQIVPVLPTARYPGFDLAAAYAVESEVVSVRRASGRRTVGRKVGFANKALWRVLALDTVAWAHMYEDTVRYAEKNHASISLDAMCSPKIEPEIVFKMKQPLDHDVHEPAAVLNAVEWLALGFEIVDCMFAGWKFQPADFVAAFGFHAALIVGDPVPVTPASIPALVDQLPRFKLTLMKDGQTVEEGSGRNSLRSPALCVAELASAISRQAAAEPLAAGELVSTGSLTEARGIAPGETWTATTDGLDALDGKALTVRIQPQG